MKTYKTEKGQGLVEFVVGFLCFCLIAIIVVGLFAAVDGGSGGVDKVAIVDGNWVSDIGQYIFGGGWQK